MTGLDWTEAAGPNHDCCAVTRNVHRRNRTDRDYVEGGGGGEKTLEPSKARACMLLQRVDTVRKGGEKTQHNTAEIRHNTNNTAETRQDNIQEQAERGRIEEKKEGETILHVSSNNNAMPSYQAQPVALALAVEIV